eukprot:2947124-Lingulodinium_polyedra.AAC.1
MPEVFSRNTSCFNSEFFRSRTASAKLASINEMLMRGPVAFQENRLSSLALEDPPRLLQSSQVLGILALRPDSGGPAGGVCLIIPRR